MVCSIQCLWDKREKNRNLEVGEIRLFVTGK